MPINPSEPEVKVESFQGPPGDQSVNVMATRIVPVVAKTRHSAFAPIRWPVGRHA